MDSYKKWGVISMLCGVVGLLGFIPFVGWLFSPLWVIALATGIKSLRYKENIPARVGQILGCLILGLKCGFWFIFI